ARINQPQSPGEAFRGRGGMVVETSSSAGEGRRDVVCRHCGWRGQPVTRGVSLLGRVAAVCGLGAACLPVLLLLLAARSFEFFLLVLCFSPLGVFLAFLVAVAAVTT